MVDGITAASLATPVVKGALENFGKTLANQVGRIAKNVVDDTVVDFQIGFQEYLTTSYNRCRLFKTILNPHEPLEVISHYVHVTLSCGGAHIKDDELLSRLNKLKRVVVTGLAGSGKSMFMKYLTVCKFEAPRGIVPLFVELRHMNALTERNLLEFIRASCTSRMKTFSKEQFELSLRAGALLLILDGFDEVNHEYRDDIQAQILQLQKDFPETQVVISSRPDDGRFGSWTSFYVYKVNRLSKKQCVELIGSLKYDSGVKKRFLREVKNKLYASHESFLSSPLLTTIMLLTYEEFAEIPDKMHAFYGQAFDTLFQKHDAQKEQYQRRTHTELARDDFRLCLSAFSALSYLDERFSFDDDALNKTAEQAIRYSVQTSRDFPAKVTAKELVADLQESVCILQKDGLETAYVHRSFQEYFAALFAANLHGAKVKQVLDRYALRFHDTVVSMALDMARETVEQEWVIPTVEHLRATLGPATESGNLGTRLGLLVGGGTLYRHQQRLFAGFHQLRDELLAPLETICRIYPNRLGQGFVVRPINRLNIGEAREKLLRPEFVHCPGYARLEKLLAQTGQIHQNIDIDIDENDDWWLRELGMAEMFRDLDKAFTAIIRDIQQRAKRRTAILDEFI